MYSEYDKKPTTRAWDLYEAGKLYNNRLSPNLYKMVDANTEFLAGNQWLNLPKTPALNALPKPVFNILKRVNNLFIASLTSSAARLNLEPLTYVDGENLNDPNTNAASFANAEVANLFEKFDMDYKIRQALSDGSVTGDYCAHFYWDPHARPYGGAFGSHRGEICMELVDGVNVMFGNPNNRDVEVQPYVLVYGRDTVQSLKDEVERRNKGAKKNRKKSQETEESYSADDLIQADSDFNEQVGESGKIEITGDDGGKAAYIYLYEKVTEYVKGEYVTTVHVSKMTKNTVIFEDVDTGLSCYPIAWGNWETQKNQYHGRALITGLIPNQIYINNMFAMVMRHQQLMLSQQTRKRRQLNPRKR